MKRSPILAKVSSFMKISTKLRKPIILNLILCKLKTNKVKKFQLLRHYNYGFIQEYQFSPSNSHSPLIFRHERRYLGRKEKEGRDFQSVLFLCMCFGSRFRDEEDRDEVCYSMEVFPANGIEVEMSELIEDRSSSVDERAERFIEKFYAQIRMQSQESSSTALVIAD